MEILTIPIDQLIPDPANARKHSEKNLDAVKGSLAKFGQQMPIVIDAANVVIAGNARLVAAKALGWTEIKCVRSSLDKVMAAAYGVADNRTGELAEWDDEALAKILTSLKNDNFDLDAIGFDHEDLLQWLKEPEIVPGCDEDEVPEVSEPKTKPGDLYELGNHRLLCGDSTNVQHVERLMGGEKADAVITDPPYGIGFKYQSHDDSEEKWFDLINNVMGILKTISPFIVMPCCRIKSLDWWYANHKPDWIMCWYKGSPGHRSMIGFNDWEPHLVWGKPKNQMHDYWQTKCGFEIEGHPCPKPVEYSEWLVERAINARDIVLEPFCGSGSTLIACEKTKRRCFGMEIDPHYCDVIIARWEKYSGKKAKLINGPT